MADKRTSKDEELIKNLRRKLDWYTYEATEEEFDEKQVQAILDLLDALDPLPDARVLPDGSIVEGAAGDNSSVSDGTQEDTAAGVSIYDAQAALQRFQKKYNISDADLAGKTAASVSHTDVEFGKELSFGDSMKYGFTPDPASIPASDSGFSAETAGKNGRTTSFFSRRPGRIAVAACLMLLAMAAGVGIFSINGSAVSVKSFLEEFWDGVSNYRKIVVTGNEMEESVKKFVESEEVGKSNYDSWEDMTEGYGDILVPQYLPKDAVLVECYKKSAPDFISFRGIYAVNQEKYNLIISVRYLENKFGEHGYAILDDWALIQYDEERNIRYFQQEDMFRADFNKGNCTYTVEWDNLEEVQKIAVGMMK